MLSPKIIKYRAINLIEEIRGIMSSTNFEKKDDFTYYYDILKHKALILNHSFTNHGELLKINEDLEIFLASIKEKQYDEQNQAYHEKT